MEQKASFNSVTRPVERTGAVYQNWRARFVSPLLYGSLIIGLFALVPALISAENRILDGIFLAVYALIALAAFIRFPYQVRMGVFLLAVFVLGVSELFSTGILGDALFFFLAFIILSAMMISPVMGIAANALTVLTYGTVGWLILTETVLPLNPASLKANVQDWLSASAITLLFGGIIIMGFRRLETEFKEAQKQVDQAFDELRDERNNLEKNVSQRTRQLRRVNEIARTVSALLDPEEVLSRVAQLIGKEFDCYYVALYLLDSTGQWAELRDATGEAGKALKENKHRVDANSKNTIGVTIRSKQPHIAPNVGDETFRSENPLLPYTRSQITLPLIIGNRAVGALDLHSTKEYAFNTQDIDTLQNMSNQAAIAIENARLFREAQQTLSELRATQKQYLQTAWTAIATEQGLEYDLGDEDFTNQTRDIEIPLALRDQIIGQINMATEDEWTSEQRNLVEAIAAQAAQALENARLMEDSQSTAIRERLTSEITSRIWASPTIDGILQTTIRELGRALNASEALIELKVEDKGAS